MKTISIKLTIVVSIFLLFFFLVGFGWTLQHQFFNTSDSNVVVKNEDNRKDSNINQNKTIVALGDSLTRGTGDAAGKGYIGYLVDELEEKSNEKITLQNLGVKGFRSNQLLEQIGQAGVRDQIHKADIILITIGGNDLFQSGQTIIDMNLQQIDLLRNQYLGSLEKIIAELRENNEKATIYFIGLYNPFIDLNDAAVMTKVVRQWNYETSELLDKHPQTVFVPTFDLFQLKVNDYLYTDKFHPNTEGYRLIAERVASLITW
ncbi:SGNH/GDSL hydrolase family protein [Pseudoneobacillus sp. C159]